MPRPFKPLSELKYPRRPNGGHVLFRLSDFYDDNTCQWDCTKLLRLCSLSPPPDTTKRLRENIPTRDFHKIRILLASDHLRSFMKQRNIPSEIFHTSSRARPLVIARHQCYKFLRSFPFTYGVIAFVCNTWRTAVRESLENNY